MINFLGAIGIGVVIGLIGGFALRSKQANAIWMAPALAVGGSLLASVAALIFGDRNDYGWKEMILQVVLSAVGVGIVAYLASKNSSTTKEPAASS
jgi:hypothetical protein